MKKVVLATLLATLTFVVGRLINDGDSMMATVTTTTPTPTLEIAAAKVESVPEESLYRIDIVKSEAVALAQMAWGEARCCSTVEIAATMWTVLNRVDATGFGMGNSLEYVISFPNQFQGYSSTNPVTDELYALAVDVLTRWQLERQGIDKVGRILPKDYLYFHGDGERNWFRNTYEHTGEYWDWSLPNPYEELE